MVPVRLMPLRLVSKRHFSDQQIVEQGHFHKCLKIRQRKKLYFLCFGEVSHEVATLREAVDRKLVLAPESFSRKSLNSLTSQVSEK